MTERTNPSAADWLVFALLLGGALLMCGPFIWMISTSLKPMAEVFAFPPTLFSPSPQPENYLRIFTAIPFGRAIANSLIVAGSVTVLQLVVCSLAAYAFACLRFRGREALFLIYLSALMVPSQVTLIRTSCWSATSAGSTATRGSSCPMPSRASAPSCCAST